MRKATLLVGVVLILLSAGCTRRSDLVLAAMAGNREKVEALLDGGADVNAADSDGVTAIMVAARQGHTAVVKLLLEGGADPDPVNDYGYAAIHPATARSHADTAEALLDGGADIEIEHEGTLNGATPLIVATGADSLGSRPERREAVVRLLIRRGAKIDAQDWWNRTALFQAVESGETELAKLLIAAGGGVNAKDPFGMT
ncbi:MAG: ankyrin repeat domain-containing protein, partial [Candidatus Brocadiia bacterium]|nr:ankyrin repeat domain-containing protein [Candidatus Brocadiia bacterium]